MCNGRILKLSDSQILPADILEGALRAAGNTINIHCDQQKIPQTHKEICNCFRKKL